MKTRLPEDLADQQGPEQSLRRNLGLLPTVSRILEIPSEAKTPCHKVEQMTWRRTVHFFFFLCFLLALQHEQLCVGRQHFADGILKLPSRLDPAPHLLDPLLGDVLDTFFPLDHEGQRPDGMATVLGTMTGGLFRSGDGEDEGAREGIGGDRETAQQLKLALTQSGSEGSVTFMDHLNV